MTSSITAIQQGRSAGLAKRLSPREMQVLGMLRRDDGGIRTNREISEMLEISLRTAKSHVENIMQKLMVDSRYRIMEATSSPTMAIKSDGKRIFVSWTQMDVLDALTDREGRVRLNRDIAADLGITERTVKFHLTNIMKKFREFGVRNRHDLALHKNRAAPDWRRRQSCSRNAKSD